MPDRSAGGAPARPLRGPVRVYLEQGKRWVFVCALDWPGWCRRGRSAELALEGLIAYARELGVRHREPAAGDTAAVAALRAEVRAVLSSPSDGIPPVPKGWPARYAARRIAWHALDHAWEIEDRSEPGG